MEPILPLLPLAARGFATDQLELTVLKLVKQKSQRKQMKRLLLINLFFFFLPLLIIFLLLHPLLEHTASTSKPLVASASHPLCSTKAIYPAPPPHSSPPAVHPQGQGRAMGTLLTSQRC